MRASASTDLNYLGSDRHSHYGGLFLLGLARGRSGSGGGSDTFLEVEEVLGSEGEAG